MSKAKIVVNLDPAVHSDATTEVLADGILYMAGTADKITLTLADHRVLKTVDSYETIKNAIKAAKAADKEPTRG